MFVLDTNTVLDYFRGRGRVAERLLTVPPSEIALPAISAHEVWVGALGSQNSKRRREQFDAFLSVVKVLPFDGEALYRAAEVGHELERKGEPIGPLDTLIAGTALACGGILVTRNLRELSRVPGLEIVNWHD